MKQQIISGLKKKLLIAELPEGANRFSIFNDEKPYLSYFKGYDTRRFYLPGKCVLIGKLTDITEEQFESFCDFFIYEDEAIGTKENVFRDYGEKMFMDTAKESFLSKLEVEGICFENPLPKPAKDDYSFYTDINLSVQEEWNQAQEKVWDINRCWIFQIIE